MVVSQRCIRIEPFHVRQLFVSLFRVTPFHNMNNPVYQGFSEDLCVEGLSSPSFMGQDVPLVLRRDPRRHTPTLGVSSFFHVPFDTSDSVLPKPLAVSTCSASWSLL